MVAQVRISSSLIVLQLYMSIDSPNLGINLSFVRLLLSKGCSVVIADLALRPEAESLLTQHPANSSPSCHFHRTNVSSWPNLQTLWDFSAKAFPKGIDIVVAGAGVFEPRSSAFWEAPRTETNPETASRDDANGEPGHYMQLDVNLASPIRLAQMAVGHWTQQKQRGCLIFVGSIAGYNATVASPLYHASKFGLLGFARSLGDLKEAAGIRVSYMAPAQVRVCSSPPSLITARPRRRDIHANFIIRRPCG